MSVDNNILCAKQMPYGSHTCVDSRVRVSLRPPPMRFENGKRGWLKSIVKYFFGIDDSARAHISTEKLNEKGQPSQVLVSDVALQLGLNWDEVK